MDQADDKSKSRKKTLGELKKKKNNDIDNEDMKATYIYVILTKLCSSTVLRY